MNKTTMKNTASITIPASKLQVGDFVVDEIGMPPVRIRAVKLDPRGALIVVSLSQWSDGLRRCYLKGENVVAHRSFSKLSKAQLTKALKAVQKQQNTLACQASDLQDAIAEIERTKKPAKSTFKVVKASEVMVGDTIDSADFPGGFKKVKSIGRRLHHELEFHFATDPVSLCLWSTSPVQVLKTK